MQRVHTKTKRFVLMIVAAICLAAAQPAFTQALPETAYWMYVAAESEDQVALLRYGPEGFEVAKTIDVGIRPTEIEGPHGVRVSPDGAYWYVSVAHGNPFGSVHKFRTGTDSWEAAAEVGMFPATMDIAANTGLLYVANFDLHGEMIPGSISVVETDAMVEVARIEVGVMPHGSRLNDAGDRHYSVMMMSDELVETNAFGFAVGRRLSLGDRTLRDPGGAMPMAVGKPTWVEPSPDGRFLYVALNGADEIREVDIDRWEVSRVFETSAGPYNVGLSPDGRWLVATYRTDGSTGVWDLASGQQRAQIVNSRVLPHGVAMSPDSRYAFVSVEGIGGEAGSVDVIGLETAELVGSVDIGKQASGIAFWKTED